MKSMILGIILLFSAAMILVGCTDSKTDTEIEMDTETEEDGSRLEYTDSSAPKTISSTEILSFRCEFSVASYEEEDTKLQHEFYQFSAVLKGNQVQGSYTAVSGNTTQIQEEFATDASFMEQLQKIVSRHDLAQNNGHSVEIQGLPDMYGARLDVVYVSDERIYAYDNESNFLTIAAMEELERYFYKSTEQQEDDIVFPAPLDLTIAEEWLMEDAEGCFLEVTYPVLSLEYADLEMDSEHDDEYKALRQALDEYNLTVRMDQESKLYSTLPAAAKQLLANGEDVEGLYSFADVYVTRSDEQILSFYEEVIWYEWWLEEQSFWSAYNFDVKSGRLLGYEDVFTDSSSLPEVLAGAFRISCPQIEWGDDTEAVLEEAIGEANSGICFALGHGGVHFFVTDNRLVHNNGGMHLCISYADYPDLVKKEYQATSENWLMELQYDTEYLLEGIGKLSLTWSRPYEDEEEVKWTVSAGESEYTESFYGYQPDCCLAKVKGSYFICMQVPTGDISQFMNLYEITAEGIFLAEEAELGMYEKTGTDPEKILLYENDMVFTGYDILIPYSMYRISENGSFVSVDKGEYRIDSGPMILQKDIRVREIDPEDCETVTGLTDVESGTVMIPFRTDKETYLDFQCEDGRVCRFEIIGFTDKMNLDGFGTMSELFVSQGYLSVMYSQ